MRGTGWARSCACLLLACQSAHAYAQSTDATGARDEAAPAEEQSGLQDIVVTANRRSQSAQSAPLAIAALGAEQIISRGITDSQQLQKAVPGLFYGNNAGFAQPYIRGIGTGITVPGAESSVATFIDDVYQSQPFFTIQTLNAVDRIEVLKGPQGTLYGRNATGGAIRIETRNPSDHFETDNELIYGNYDYKRLNSYISAPLAEGVGANLAVVVSDRDGFGKILNRPGERVNSERFVSLRGKLAIALAANFDARLTGYYMHENDTKNTATTYSDRFGSIPTAVGLGGLVTYYSQDIYASYPVDNGIDAAGGNLRLRWHGPGVTVTSVSAYSDLSYISGGDFLSASIPIFNFQARKGRAHGFYQSLEVLGDSNGPFTWLVGGNYVDDSASFDRLIVFSGPNLASQSVATVKTKAYAVYGEASYKLTDRLTATGGLRYSDETKTQARVDAYNGAGTLLSSAPRRSRDWSQVTYKALLRYQLDQAMVYAKIETGFKSGTVNTLVPGSFISPEKITSYEAGVKSDLFDRTVRLNLSGFYYDYRNLQQQYNDIATGSSLLESAQKARVYGGEMEFNALVTPDLQLSLTGNLMKGEFVAFQSRGQFVPRASISPPPPGGPITSANAGNVVQLADVSGNRLVRAPTFTGTASIEYKVPLGDGSLVANASYYYSTKLYFDASNRIKQPAYNLVDGRITYNFPGDRISASLWGQNLTNATYIQGSALSATGDQIRIASPRQYGVSARYRF